LGSDKAIGLSWATSDRTAGAQSWDDEASEAIAALRVRRNPLLAIDQTAARFDA
jgi:hypothetical protein